MKSQNFESTLFRIISNMRLCVLYAMDKELEYRLRQKARLCRMGVQMRATRSESVEWERRDGVTGQTLTWMIESNALSEHVNQTSAILILTEPHSRFSKFAAQMKDLRKQLFYVDTLGAKVERGLEHPFLLRTLLGEDSKNQIWLCCSMNFKTEQSQDCLAPKDIC